MSKMKVGVYVSGLGSAFNTESIEKYGQRLANEMNFNTVGVEFGIKAEKVRYSENRYTTIISIVDKAEEKNIVYKLYEFRYDDILIGKFESFSLILKNLWLFYLVVIKAPIVFRKLFYSEIYRKTGQTFYLFLIFFVLSFGVLLMIPSTVDLILGDAILIDTIKQTFGITDIPYITKDGINDFSKGIVSVITTLLFFVPTTKLVLLSLATEFICINDYLEHGAQRQLILGNLDQLIDYITENEVDSKIHFHAYSFGSIISLDYLFPFGNKLPRNAEIFCEAIITIGNPFEFIKTYYPVFYNDRIKYFDDKDKIYWLNVYSKMDALATNFRADSAVGESEFGIDNSSIKPININYEVANVSYSGLFSFFMLYGLKVHGMYWESNVSGQSCLRLIYEKMNQLQLIGLDTKAMGT